MDAASWTQSVNQRGRPHSRHNLCQGDAKMKLKTRVKAGVGARIDDNG